MGYYDALRLETFKFCLHHVNKSWFGSSICCLKIVDFITILDPGMMALHYVILARMPSGGNCHFLGDCLSILVTLASCRGMST
jgi:hypothetical protein